MLIWPSIKPKTKAEIRSPVMILKLLNRHENDEIHALTDSLQSLYTHHLVSHYRIFISLINSSGAGSVLYVQFGSIEEFLQNLQHYVWIHS